MIDVNETLAEFFKKRSVCDADGVFHYLLQERDEELVVDTTPYGPEWASVFQEDTLVIDCTRNEVGLVWVINGDYLASVMPFPVDTIYYQDSKDTRYRCLVFAGSDIVAMVNLPPDGLNFWIGPRKYFDQDLYMDTFRVLSSQKDL